MSLQAIDELGQEVIAAIFVSEVVQVNSTSKISLDHILYVFRPNKTIPFLFRVPEASYNKIKNKEVRVNRTIQFSDIFSGLPNGYSFDVELQTCRPGFVFSRDRQKCVCNTQLDAIQR